jgi:hypothetical protein
MTGHLKAFMASGRTLVLLAALFGCLGFTAERALAGCGLNCVGCSCCYNPKEATFWRVSPDPCNGWYLSTAGCAYPYCKCTGQSATLTFTEQDPAKVKLACPGNDVNSVQATGCPADKDGGKVETGKCCASCALS